jgi:hypothetical protein
LPESIRSAICIPLDIFQFSAITNKTVINIAVFMFMFSYVLGISETLVYVSLQFY